MNLFFVLSEIDKSDKDKVTISLKPLSIINGREIIKIQNKVRGS